MSIARTMILDVGAGVRKPNGWKSNAGGKSRNGTLMPKKALVPLLVVEATGRKQARQITRSSVLARRTIKVTVRERCVLSTNLFFCSLTRLDVQAPRARMDDDHARM